MRYLESTIEGFSEEKFVFLAGPRQVGKTTLAQNWLRPEKNGLYLNWDVIKDRERFLRPGAQEDVAAYTRVVLDEIHKYARWKSWVKGLYDKHRAGTRVVVTGSARLDVYHRSGDSLLGRYELLRLHPFTVGELMRKTTEGLPRDWLEIEPVGSAKQTGLAWERLARRSGFPEPFKRDTDLQHRRWSTRRRDLVIREDLRDTSEIRQISLVEHLALLLPTRVGSPLSLNALREEISVAHDTVRNWLDALERLYFCFRLSPYSHKLSRSLRKEQKLYLWDWSQVPEGGPRFENMVANHLLKATHYWTDLGYGEFQLWYCRDVDKYEVDFLITNARKPVVLIEAKDRDTVPSPALLRLGKKMKVPMVQLVRHGSVDMRKGSLRVVTAHRYLSALP